MFTSISNSKNYQQIIKQIKDAIICGQLKVGDRLPNELDMAQEFNVSRSSVREALKSLEVLGIVESRKGGGSFIANNINRSMTDSLSIYFMLNGCSIQDLIDMRVALELGAIRTIIDRRTDEEIETLGAALRDYIDAPDLESRKLCDQNFHAVLISLARNPLYDFLLNAHLFIFAKDVSYSHQVVEERGQLDDSVKMHTAIYEAIKNRDFAAAAKELFVHFNFTDEDLELQGKYFYSENPGETFRSDLGYD